jgi:hypothetical protein
MADDNRAKRRHVLAGVGSLLSAGAAGCNTNPNKGQTATLPGEGQGDGLGTQDGQPTAETPTEANESNNGNNNNGSNSGNGNQGEVIEYDGQTFPDPQNGEAFQELANYMWGKEYIGTTDSPITVTEFFDTSRFIKTGLESPEAGAALPSGLMNPEDEETYELWSNLTRAITGQERSDAVNTLEQKGYAQEDEVEGFEIYTGGDMGEVAFYQNTAPVECVAVKDDTVLVAAGGEEIEDIEESSREIVERMIESSKSGAGFDDRTQEMAKNLDGHYSAIDHILEEPPIQTYNLWVNSGQALVHNYIFSDGELEKERDTTVEPDEYKLAWIREE